MRGRAVELRGWVLGFGDGRRVRIWVEGGTPEEERPGEETGRLQQLPRQCPQGEGALEEALPEEAPDRGRGLPGEAWGGRWEEREEQGPALEQGDSPVVEEPPGQERSGGELPQGRPKDRGSGTGVPGREARQETRQEGQSSPPAGEERDGRRRGHPGRDQAKPQTVGRGAVREETEILWEETGTGDGLRRAVQPVLPDWEEEQEAAERRRSLRFGVEMERWLW